MLVLVVVFVIAAEVLFEIDITTISIIVLVVGGELACGDAGTCIIENDAADVFL